MKVNNKNGNTSGKTGLRPSRLRPVKGIKRGVKQGLKEGIQKGMDKGLKQGKQVEKAEIAKNLKHMGLADELIIQATGLTKAAIQKR